MRLVATPWRTDAPRAKFQRAVVDAAVETGVPVDERDDITLDDITDQLPPSVDGSLDSLLGSEAPGLEGALLVFEGDRPVFPWRTDYYLEPFFGLGVSQDVLEVLRNLGSAAALLPLVQKAAELACERFLENDQLVLTSYGTIHSKRFTDAVADRFEQFLGSEQRSLAVVTGWGGPRKVDEIVSQVDPDAVVTEGGTVLHHRENDYQPEPLFVSDTRPRTPRQLAEAGEVYDHPDLRRTRAAWSRTLDALWDELDADLPVLLSQGNQYSVCVYPNPPGRVRDRLPDPPDTTVETVRALQGRLTEEPLLPNDVGLRPVDGAKHIGRIDGSRDGRYVLEKLQAKHRTFAPYRLLSVDGEEVVFELLDSETDLDPIEEGAVGVSADEIENVEGATRESLRGNGDPVTSGADRYVVGQSNSVDVFVQRKVDAYGDEFRERIGVTDADEVHYLHRGNRRNNRFVERIVEVERQAGRVVETFAPTNVPDAVTAKVDHVVEGRDITDVIPRFHERSLEL